MNFCNNIIEDDCSIDFDMCMLDTIRKMPPKSRNNAN